MTGSRGRRKRKRLCTKGKIVQGIAVLVATPAVAAFVSPSIDALDFLLNWLLLVSVFEAGFLSYRWLSRKQWNYG
jgi:hypothetical protein